MFFSMWSYALHLALPRSVPAPAPEKAAEAFALRPRQSNEKLGRRMLASAEADAARKASRRKLPRTLTYWTSPASFTAMNNSIQSSNSGIDVWQLHEAKARFSELFRRARTAGVQKVVKQGGDAVVVVPAEEFYK